MRFGTKKVLNSSLEDVSNPRIEGSLRVAGEPVELYVVGERAIVLLNNWWGYAGGKDSVRVEAQSGGVIMQVDISDRSAPVLLSQANLKGEIRTSRLTQGGGRAALYVAAQLYEVWGPDNRQIQPNTSVIRSFDVSGDRLVEQSELDLGGYVVDVAATTDVMMVARNDYTQQVQTGSVGLIDISDPAGAMVQGADVSVSGIVQNKFNMDVYEGVLRVASSSNGLDPNNHLETFDVSDLSDAVPVAHCTYGSGQSLFATLFVEERAFLVTYLRQDPFHAFSVDRQGRCQERNEFIVSGWNDFFRAVDENTRMIGIGRNDENRTNLLAVSLYDISNLSNTRPLLARAEIELAWSSSEASWDDRAFSVLEGAVTATAEDGTEEHGLVLLPYEGWNEQDQSYVADVQLFTFSQRTLTRRGVMSHGTPVRRSFVAGEDTTVNLSDAELSTFDNGDPDAPREVGRVTLAPNISNVFVYGDHVARVLDGQQFQYNTISEPSSVEIVERDGDLETQRAIASISVAAGAQLVQVGDLLVSVLSVYDSASPADRPSYDTTIDVFDLSDPTAPVRTGGLKTDRLELGGGYGPFAAPPFGGPAIDCFDCRSWPGASSVAQFAVSKAIVFPQPKQQQQSRGFVTYCYESPVTPNCNYDINGNPVDCPDEYYAGAVSCEKPVGGEESCTGEFYECSYKSGECKVAPAKYGTSRNCSSSEAFRYWTAYSFEVLDLRDPGAPAFADRVDAPEDEEGTTLISAGDTVYFNYQKPLLVSGDPRPFVRRYVRRLDASDPGSPHLGRGINIPGEVIAADGDTLFTRDTVWDAMQTETLVARLTVDGNVARLEAQRFFDERVVTAVLLDGAGHALVSHDPAYNAFVPVVSSGEPPLHRLTILDQADLAVRGETDIDSWAQLTTADAGRAVFTVNGGLLIVNTEDPEQPAAQAFFPTLSWTNRLLISRGEILLAAGPYGLYRFDADENNLMSP